MYCKPFWRNLLQLSLFIIYEKLPHNFDVLNHKNILFYKIIIRFKKLKHASVHCLFPRYIHTFLIQMVLIPLTQTYILITIISSPKHKLVMMSYCDRPLSFIIRCASIKHLLHTSHTGFWLNFTGMIPGWSPTKIVQMVSGWLHNKRHRIRK